MNKKKPSTELRTLRENGEIGQIGRGGGAVEGEESKNEDTHIQMISY